MQQPNLSRKGLEYASTTADYVHSTMHDVGRSVPFLHHQILLLCLVVDCLRCEVFVPEPFLSLGFADSCSTNRDMCSRRARTMEFKP